MLRQFGVIDGVYIGCCVFNYLGPASIGLGFWHGDGKKAHVQSVIRQGFWGAIITEQCPNQPRNTLFTDAFIMFLWVKPRMNCAILSGKVSAIDWCLGIVRPLISVMT